jgi:hypothetical protein
MYYTVKNATAILFIDIASGPPYPSFPYSTRHQFLLLQVQTVLLHDTETLWHNNFYEDMLSRKGLLPD